MKLDKIVFPVYKLPNNSIIKREDNLILISNVYNSDKFSILDIEDKNIPSLGIRRLHFKLGYIHNNRILKRKLFKLTKPIFSYSDLLITIKIKNQKFIDNSGKIFFYTKSKYVPLVYYKILGYTESPQGVIIHTELNVKFIVNKFPDLDIKYVGVLCIGKGYLLYNLSKTKLESSRRMI